MVSDRYCTTNVDWYAVSPNCRVSAGFVTPNNECEQLANVPCQGQAISNDCCSMRGSESRSVIQTWSTDVIWSDDVVSVGRVMSHIVVGLSPIITVHVQQIADRV